MSVISRSDTAIVIVDVQERLAPAMHQTEWLVERTRTLAAIANALNIPMLVTEQYPAGLGPTVPAIRDQLGDTPIFAKSSFSAFGSEDFVNQLEHLGRRTIALAGIESHICVLQTALDAIDRGYQVHLVADAVASRRGEDRSGALDRMSQAGISLSCVESVGFECLGAAGSDDFRAVARLIR